jgi:hypothetical protein
MDEFEGESASTRDTLRYCVQLARPYGRFLLAGAGFLVLGVIITDVATLWSSQRCSTVSPSSAHILGCGRALVP